MMPRCPHLRRLAERAPGFVERAKDKEDVEAELSRCRLPGFSVDCR
jgi:hypothetical protein